MPKEPNPNPAFQHQEILNAIPAEFHSQVIPVLKKWDQGVEAKLNEVKSEYEGLSDFKKLVDNNIDYDYVEKAVILADQFQQNPQHVIDEVNKAWDLGYISKDEAEALKSQGSNSQDDDDLDDLDDPRMKSLMENQKRIQEAIEKQQQESEAQRKQREEEEAASQFEDYLDELEEEVTGGENPLPFNRTFVTALMAQGVDGEDAVKQYHEILAENASVNDSEGQNNEQQNNDQPPVVMGGAGTAGSGNSDGAIDFSKTSKNDLNSAVEQMIAQAQDSGQG